MKVGHKSQMKIFESAVDYMSSLVVFYFLFILSFKKKKKYGAIQLLIVATVHHRSLDVVGHPTDRCCAGQRK